MKQYPKIEYFNQGLFGEDVYAFDKLDGSNIRCEWGRKRGWYKFGTRNTMIDKSNSQFGEAIDLFMDKYSESLSRIFTDHREYRKIESFVVFSEYVGNNSFAGRHIPTDEMDIVLFDVNQYKKGFVNPYQFIKDFGNLGIPDVVYHGEYTMDFVSKIRQNEFNLKEGVICKGTSKSKNGKDEVWMVKVKTVEWLLKVKALHGDRALLEELNGDKTLMV